jgi:hypothetical protein
MDNKSNKTTYPSMTLADVETFRVRMNAAVLGALSADARRVGADIAHLTETFRAAIGQGRAAEAAKIAVKLDEEAAFLREITANAQRVLRGEPPQPAGLIID